MLIVALFMCVKNDFTILYFLYVFLFLIPHIFGFLIIDLVLMMLSTYLKLRAIYFSSSNTIYILSFVISFIGLNLFSVFDLYSNELSTDLNFENYCIYMKKNFYPVAAYNIIFIVVNFWASKKSNSNTLNQL